MSFNICAFSGNLLEVPVISKKTGHVFEKRLIEKHIDATGQCPITGNELTKDDLLEIKTSKVTKPRNSSSTNIPSLLSNLQSEWDTLMLETFNMKQQLDVLRQELSHSLYQHDAACRVICRLIKERDEARTQLANIRTDIDNLQQEEEEQIGEEFENMGIYKELLDRMNEIFQTLSSKRKKREISAELIAPNVLNAYTVINSYPLHSTSKPGITCMDLDINRNLILTGGNDGRGILFSKDQEKVIFDCESHSKKINDAIFYPCDDVLAFLLCSADNTASFWMQNNDEEEIQFEQRYIVKSHKMSVSSASFHPLKEYCLTASKDATWSFHNMVKGVSLLTQATVSGKSIDKIRFHPDGLIFGTCEADGVVRIWDVSSQQNVAAFECHKSEVTGISFSENGYYLATSSRNENIVKLWDLRKPKNFKTLEFAEKDVIQNVEFDYSGNYLGIVGNKANICTVKEWSLNPMNLEHTDLITGIKFGQNCKYIATVSLDRQLKISG